jgi:hypothetical protein
MDNDIDRRAGEGPGGLAPGLSALSDDQLTVGYDDVLVASRKAEWDRLAIEAEIDRREMYKADGVPSLREWISTRTAEGDRAAYHQALLARTLPGFPRLSEALADGRLSVAHVRLLLTLARLTGAEDEDVVAVGEAHTVPQLETACRAARRLSRRVDDEADGRRHLRWRCDDTGTFHLHGRLHGSDGLIVTNLLAAMAESSVPDPTTGVLEPWDTRCADALVELCQDPDSPNQDVEVVIHADLHTLTASPSEPEDTEPEDTGGSGAGGSGAGGTPMTWDGTVISTPSLRRLLCDCGVRLTGGDREGRVVGIGRRSRTIPGWLLGQLRWRDQGCRFPGCSRTRWLHGHHITHWADGGPTDLSNIAMTCSRHHRALHEGQWRLHGDANGVLCFTGPRGRTHTTRPAITATQLRPTRRRGRQQASRPSDPPAGREAQNPTTKQPA